MAELALPKATPANPKDDGERNIVQGNVLSWIDALHEGRCQKVIYALTQPHSTSRAPRGAMPEARDQRRAARPIA